MTNKMKASPYIETSNAYGSFNTIKNNLSFGTGMINNHWGFEGRISRIKSDGFIDRAASDLLSYFLSGGWYGKRSVIKFTMLSGKEITYQAWNGVPEFLLDSNRTFNAFTYKNQVDNYKQDHYQLLFGYDLLSNLHIQVTLHDTKGKGYYEEYKAADDYYGGGSFSSYGLPDIINGNDTITATDLIRRKWLDNDFYGGIIALVYEPAKLKLTLGGGWNQYDGDHFNEITWARYANNITHDYRYEYDNALKTDFNVYLKGYYEISKRLSLMADLQVRNTGYNFSGFDDSFQPVPQNAGLSFFNPKAGVNFQIINNLAWYGSVSKASKEPSRDDFTETTPGSRPDAETMIDYETGLRYQAKKIAASVNYYRMNYTNQLVLTGKINDVGNYTRTNVPHSYRQGVEVEFNYMPFPVLALKGNATFSENKIRQFDEYIDNYDDGSQQHIIYENTDLAFSPDITGAGVISLIPVKNLSVDFISKYVGKQFLDNTASENRKINDYTVCNLHINYALHFKIVKEIRFTLGINNLFSRKYVSNGYTYSYVSGGDFITENFYFPQAPVHYMGQVTVKF